MESFYEIEDELRAIIIKYADACKEWGFDPTEKINNLIEQEQENI